MGAFNTTFKDEEKGAFAGEISLDSITLKNIIAPVTFIAKPLRELLLKVF